MQITYKNATKDVTIQDCLAIHNTGTDIFVDEGRDVTFETREKTNTATKEIY